MKKQEHPIDKLFAGKLQGLESTPSANAWSRLETGLQQKKADKKGVIWWYCAAAIAALIVLGSVWITLNDSPRGIDLATSASGMKNNPITSNFPKNESIVKEQSAQPASKEVLSQHKPEAQTGEKTNVISTERVAKVSKSVSKPLPIQNTEKVEAEHSVPQAPAPMRSTVEEMIAKQVPNNTLAPAPATEKGEQTLVVVVELPEEKSESSALEKGQRKAEKLWQNLKKVKHGEFRELGLDPDDLMARLRDKNEK